MLKSMQVFFLWGRRTRLVAVTAAELEPGAIVSASSQSVGSRERSELIAGLDSFSTHNCKSKLHT